MHIVIYQHVQLTLTQRETLEVWCFHLPRIA